MRSRRSPAFAPARHEGQAPVGTVLFHPGFCRTAMALAAGLSILLASCAGDPVTRALDSIRAADMKLPMRFLAAPELRGRNTPSAELDIGRRPYHQPLDVRRPCAAREDRSRARHASTPARVARARADPTR